VANRTLATGRAPGMKDGPCGLDDIRTLYDESNLTAEGNRDGVNKS
jgi:hypothetical protein